MVANNNATLMTDKGTRRVSANELNQIPAPMPTNTWFPIPHHRVLSLTQATLEDHGFHIRRVDLAVSPDNHKFFGVLDLVSDITDGVKLAVGIRNSTDKSLPAGIAVGERVSVCSNLVRRAM